MKTLYDWSRIPPQVTAVAAASGLTLDGDGALTEPDGARHSFHYPGEVLAFIRGYQARRNFTARAANLNDAPDSCAHGADDYGPLYDPTEDERK